MRSHAWAAISESSTDEGSGQSQGRARHLDGGHRQSRRGRAQRRTDQDQPNRDLRHRHPHLPVGRLGKQQHDPRSDGGRPRVRRRDRRVRRRGARFRAGRPRVGRRSHHLRRLPQLPCRPAPFVPEHRRESVSIAQARSPSTCAVPAFNVFKLPDAISDDMAAILDPLGNATHTALVVRSRRRRRPDHRRRPDRHHGRRECAHAGARHIVITDVNDYRLDLAQEDGRLGRAQRHRESIDDTMQNSA